MDQERGQQLADEYQVKVDSSQPLTFRFLHNPLQIPFYETSAKANVNVEIAILSMAKDVMRRLVAEEAAAPRSNALVCPSLFCTSFQ